jgi:hypothetical protein
MKTKLLLLSCCCALTLALPAFAIDDTPENRAKEADRYFEAAAPKEMLDEMTTQMATSVPDAEKTKFKELLTKHFNYESFVKSMKDAMVRHFTATELAALADFYSSEVGKSAMKKMGGYTAEIMPLVQTEILKAQQKAMTDQGGLTALPPGAPAKDGVPMPQAPTASVPAPPTQPTAGQPAQPGFGQPQLQPQPMQPGQPTPGQPQPQPQPQPFPAAPGSVGGIPSSLPEVISATKG